MNRNMFMMPLLSPMDRCSTLPLGVCWPCAGTASAARNLTAGTLRLQAGTGAPVLQDPAILQHLSGVFASYGNGVREAGGRLSRVRHLLQCNGVFAQ